MVVGKMHRLILPPRFMSENFSSFPWKESYLNIGALFEIVKAAIVTAIAPWNLFASTAQIACTRSTMTYLPDNNAVSSPSSHIAIYNTININASPSSSSTSTYRGAGWPRTGYERGEQIVTETTCMFVRL